MRTTVTIPDRIYQRIMKAATGQSLSSFVREALEMRLEVLQREALARDMEAGYQSEAEAPSLDEGWAAIETEGLS